MSFEALKREHIKESTDWTGDFEFETVRSFFLFLSMSLAKVMSLELLSI